MTNAARMMLASPSLGALGIAVPAQGETALRCLGVIGSFSNGIGRLRTIAPDTTCLQLDGKDEVDFTKETEAFKVRPLARISGSSVAISMVVDGPFRSVDGLSVRGDSKVNAVAEILTLQAECDAWLDGLPASSRGSATAEGVQAVAGLDLYALAAIDPPREYARH